MKKIDLKDKTILVTGAAGFIGYYLSKRLLDEVDNIHAGGMFIGISDNGELMDNAFTEFQNVCDKHPDSRIKFKGYKIHGIDKMIDIAYKCHGRTPHLGLISWILLLMIKIELFQLK